MTNNSINFKQIRDFGDIFNATFNFISQEFKRMGTAILYYVVPLLLLSAITTTIYSVKLQEITQTMTSQMGNENPFAAFQAMGAIGGYVFLNLIISLIATNMLLCSVLCYIKMYITKGKEEFTINDVWREIMKNFGRILIASIIIGLVIMVGFVLCILPGLYLAVPLSLVFSIMIFEETDFSIAFNRSFKLIKSNWWNTFAIFIVTGILIYILTILLSIPAIIMGFKTMFFNMKNTQQLGMNFSVGFYVVNSITSLLSQLFYIIPLTMTAFIYYSLVEKHEKPSLIEKIDQMIENE